MMLRIVVWCGLLPPWRLAGEMVVEIDTTGRSRGAFRYAPDFLADPAAFPLDPVSLPLSPRNFTIEHPGVFSVFEDSLPDDWGRRLMVRRHAIPRQHQNLPHLLLALGSAGLGALSYTNGPPPETIDNSAGTMQLTELVAAADAYERGDITDPALLLLFGAASSPGGARPKALVHDAGGRYLAKFPSIRDEVNVVRIEAATLALAKKAGLRVPPSRLTACGTKDVLLVERFDLAADNGRRHMVSMQTLLGARGYYQLRYRDLLDVVRAQSADPREDSGLLFRQMVFNAVIGNTDDHLKNFWMLYDADAGWRLSPSFDLLPDVGRRGEHVLYFDLGAFNPGRATLSTLGRSWGVPHASAIIDQVYETVSGWRQMFRTMGVVEGDIDRFSEIDRHLTGR